MKFVALVSGGKDSIYSIMECLRNGHELIACAHLAPRLPLHQPESTEVRYEASLGDREHINRDEVVVEDESYMYQTAASECIKTQVEECLGVPCIVRTCVGRSQNTSLLYEACPGDTERQDEVEDLWELLSDVTKRYPEITAVSSGAILSTYQRTRIESVCTRLNLTPLSYLWRIGSQGRLLECMIHDGVEAVLVKVASPPGLSPQKHLNKSIRELFENGTFDRLKEKFDFHICGEGGEYETLVLDCPIFRKRLNLTQFHIVETNDGVGILKVLSCCAIDKENAVFTPSNPIHLFQEWQEHADETLLDRMNSSRTTASTTIHHFTSSFIDPSSSAHRIHANDIQRIDTLVQLRYLPQVKYSSGGLAHVSEILSPSVATRADLSNYDTSMSDAEIETALAVLEAQAVLKILACTLSSLAWMGGTDVNESTTARDIVFVHMYLTSMSHFVKINMHYKEFFGTHLPPSRSCVAVSKLPGGRRIMIDCIIQRGSGEFMRFEPKYSHKDASTFVKNCVAASYHTKLRSTLHVQSVSHWAPVCIGPYSQANTLRSGLVFLAGQIGLLPSTMRLVPGGWHPELRQCWKNAASVLDAIEGKLENIIGAVVYMNAALFKETTSLRHQKRLWEDVERLCRTCLQCNGGIEPGYTNAFMSESQLYNGYEDEETWSEMRFSKSTDNTQPGNHIVEYVRFPILMVAVSALPAGASSELELICSTAIASSCLGSTSSHLSERYDEKQEHHLLEQCPSPINYDGTPWNLGYDGPCTPRKGKDCNEYLRIEACVRSIGFRCAAISLVIASLKTTDENVQYILVNPDDILDRMIQLSLREMELKSGLDINHILHVRLYYLDEYGDDGLNFRLSLKSTLSSLWSSAAGSSVRNYPAYSVIPVQSLHLSCFECDSQRWQSSDHDPVLFAIQILATDLVHMETELWIHNR